MPILFCQVRLASVCAETRSRFAVGEPSSMYTLTSYIAVLSKMFRPCIDLHNGRVKQIVGGSLRDDEQDLRTNFVAT